MPYFRKTDSGKWEAEISMGRDPQTGKKKYKSKRFKRKKDAKNWAADMQLQKRSGMIVDSKNYNVKRYLSEWIEDHKENISTTTYDGYKTIVDVHLIPSLGAIKLKDLKPMHIKTYFRKKRNSGRSDGQSGGLSQKTLLQHYRVLSKALKEAVKMEILQRNPAKAVDAPKPKEKEILAMNKKQLKKLLKYAKEYGDWTYRFLYVAAYTGMRRGEILGLRWKDLDLKDNKIHVRNTLVTVRPSGSEFKKPKTKSGIRPIDISDKMVSIFNKIKKVQAENKLFLGPDYNNKHNLVFCKEDGSKLYPNTATRRFNRVAKKADLEQFHLHSLRHTHASLLLQAEVHPKIVQERLGHSKISQTLDTYSHLIPSMQKEAVEKLEQIMK